MGQLTNTLLRDMDTIVREMHAIYESRFKSHVLHRGQFVFITRVCEMPGVSLSELSYQLKMDKTTVTKAIQKLVNCGYIAKSQDLLDKRVWHLNPTDAAIGLYAEIIAEKNRIIKVCLGGSDLHDLEVFSKVINQIFINMTNEWSQLH